MSTAIFLQTDVFICEEMPPRTHGPARALKLLATATFGLTLAEIATRNNLLLAIARAFDHPLRGPESVVFGATENCQLPELLTRHVDPWSSRWCPLILHAATTSGGPVAKVMTKNDLFFAIAGTPDHPLDRTAPVVFGPAEHDELPELLARKVKPRLFAPLTSTTAGRASAEVSPGDHLFLTVTRAGDHPLPPTVRIVFGAAEYG
jgi:hypothetical protein